MPDGRRLAVAFFARGGSNRPAVIATAARAIYDAFESAPLVKQPAPQPTTITLPGLAPSAALTGAAVQAVQ